MKKVVTAVLFAAMSLAPMFAAGQSNPAPATTSKTDTSKTAKHATKKGKRRHKKQAMTPTTSSPTKK